MNQSLSNSKDTIIVSDLHIGSKYFLYNQFGRFLENLNGDYRLILNGDIVDSPYGRMGEPDRRIMDLLEKVSNRQEVIWLRGNHDNGYVPGGLGKVSFKGRFNIGKRLLIVHGDDFDEIMPRNRTFMKAFKILHELRVKLGAKPVHVAQYAKKWVYFYKVLRKNVMMNATNCALENGFEAVACGHTHWPEDQVFNGVRYINTGAWTESPAFYLLVTEDEILLKRTGE